jgi:hypothetical protein
MAAALAGGFAPTLYAAGAGQVDFATPGVNAVGTDGRARPLSKGSEIAPGETIDTGTGRAQLRFSDGGFVSLQPQTQFRLESYGYDKDDAKKNSIVMNLLKGGLRTITGLIGKTNREGYKLQTATATVGIRGTAFSITGFPDGSILFNVADGAIDVSNQAGSTTLFGGQSAIVTSPNSAPTKTDERPFLPPVVYGSQTLLPLPPNPFQDSNTNQVLLTGTVAGGWATADINHQGVTSPAQGSVPTFTLTPTGNLVSFGYAGNFSRTVTLGSAGVQTYGNDGVMAWGRWIGGPTTDTVFGPQTYSASDPLHFVVGLPVTNMPTSGSATYSVYGGTAPSCVGLCGAITVSSSLTVNFANLNSSSYSLAIGNSGDGVKLTSTGALNFGSSGVQFTANASTSNGITVNSGSVSFANSNIAGFLAGPGASHAGAAYSVSYYGGSYNTNIAGALVYKR